MFRNAFQKFKDLPRGVKAVTVGWTAFAGSHLVLSSEPIREKLVDTLGGQSNYRLAYGSIAASIMGGTLFQYYIRCTPEQRGRIVHNLYRASSFGKASSPGYKYSILLRALGSTFIADSFVTTYRNPLCMTESEPNNPRAVQRMYQTCGLQRVTRHHEWLGYSLYALGNLIAFNRVGDMILWGALPLFTAIGIWHQEKRLKKIKPKFYFEETSIIPFQAIIDGRQNGGKVWAELSPPAYAAFFCTCAMFIFWP